MLGGFLAFGVRGHHAFKGAGQAGAQAVGLAYNGLHGAELLVVAF